MRDLLILLMLLFIDFKHLALALSIFMNSYKPADVKLLQFSASYYILLSDFPYVGI